MSKEIKILKEIENNRYLQDFVKPYTTDYIIVSDDGGNYVLANDNSVGEYYADNRDGKKEGFVLLNLLSIDDDFRSEHCRCVIYPDKETALTVLDEMKPTLKEYFGIDKWLVKRIRTVFYLEDVNE